jgi:hypothetical protein
MLRISTSRRHPLCSYNNLIPSRHLVGLRRQIQGEKRLDKRILTALMSFERKYKRSTRDRNDIERSLQLKRAVNERCAGTLGGSVTVSPFRSKSSTSRAVLYNLNIRRPTDVGFRNPNVLFPICLRGRKGPCAMVWISSIPMVCTLMSARK